MKQPSRSARRVRNRRGLLLLPALLLMTIFFAHTAVLYTRSLTELAATNRFVDAQRSFQLAEGGLDAKLVQLRDADATNDTATIALTSQATGTYQVAVTQPDVSNAALLQVDSTGQANSATKRLRLTVTKSGPALPILGATTYIGEGSIGMGTDFFDTNALVPHTMKVDGCDRDSSQCLPALTVTTDKEYQNFTTYIGTSEPVNGYFGDRLVGAQGDYAGSAQLMSGEYGYSVHFAPQNTATGGLGYEMLQSLDAFLKQQAQANGCYFTIANDDSTSTTAVRLKNRTGVKALGTVQAPKVCYADAPIALNADGTYRFDNVHDDGLVSEDLFLDTGVEGAGILVVKGELDSNSAGTLTYQGLLISLGPSGEFEMNGQVNVAGAVLVATSEPAYDSTGGAHWIKPEFQPAGQGTVQYSSQAVAMAMQLLSGWTPPHQGSSSGSGSSVTIQTWQEP